MKKFNLNSHEDVADAIKHIESLNPQVLLLSGVLGSGKTTFTGMYLKYFYGNEFSQVHFMSPTFSIVNLYDFTVGQVAHLDLYRVTESEYPVEEILEIIEESKITFIEWPEKFTSLKTNLKGYKALTLIFDYDIIKSSRSLSCIV